MFKRVLVAVAHGSADPRASATIAELAAVADEMADVAVYLLNLSNVLDTDLSEAILRKIAKNALTRKDVQSYLFDRARLPASLFRRHFQELAWPRWMKIVDDCHTLPMTAEADNIKVVVSGGPGKHSLVVPSWGMTRSVTLPLEG